MALMTAGGLLALALLYVDIAAITLSHASGAVGQRAGGLLGATPLLIKGALLAYGDIGLALLPLGLVLIFMGQRAYALGERPKTKDQSPALRPSSFVLRRPGGWGRRVVPLAMLLTALLFFVVDVTLAMQVRYFYFALPLALSAIAIVLAQLAEHGRLARLVAWAVVLALLLQGAIAWFVAAFGDVQISMTPLTH
jgi:hypothetical protein